MQLGLQCGVLVVSKQGNSSLRSNGENLNAIVSPVADDKLIIFQLRNTHWTIELSQRLSFAAKRIQTNSIESEELHPMVIKIANHDPIQLVHDKTSRAVQLSFPDARTSNGM